MKPKLVFGSLLSSIAFVLSLIVPYNATAEAKWNLISSQDYIFGFTSYKYACWSGSFTNAQAPVLQVYDSGRWLDAAKGQILPTGSDISTPCESAYPIAVGYQWTVMNPAPPSGLSGSQRYSILYRQKLPDSVTKIAVQVTKSVPEVVTKTREVSTTVPEDVLKTRSVPKIVKTPYIATVTKNGKKTQVINSTRGLRHANEKLYTIHFAQVMPATIVSQDKATIREFVNQKGAAVMKPLGGKAGEGILFLSPEDRNLNSMIEISTKWGQEPVMIQDYLPAAKEGDKRIIVLNGEPIGAVNRIPTGSEFRGNMAVGGRVAKTEISDRELEICATLAPKLREDGLYFVGLDVIGGYLTEVNVTSPTGIREIDRLNNVSLGQQVIKWLENHLGSRD